MKVCKIFRFDAAHFLPEYDGKCRSLHGHGWVLEVELEGAVDSKTGMVADFAVLKRVVNELVIDKLDHKLLNNVVPNPTCENIIQWIADILKAHDIYLFHISRLRLYETPDSFAEECYE